MKRPDHEIDAYLEGTLTAEQSDALQAWINASPDNAAAFLHLVQTHQMLRVVGKEQKQAREAHRLLDHAALASLAEMEASAQPVDFQDVAPPFAFEAARQHKQAKDITLLRVLDDLRWAAGKVALRAIRSPQGITAGVAALLIIGLLLLSPWNNDPANTTPDPTTGPLAQSPATQPVATLTAEQDAAWDRRPGQDLYAGQRFTLTAGFAEITTHRGAVAILQAPATIELTGNNNALRLHAGKLVGLCHTESSKGFVVKTEHADITDLGTEFGVTVSPNGVETTVFVGEIAVKTPNRPAKVITQNQTARVSMDNHRASFVVEDQTLEGFARRVPREPLVTAAYINDDRFRVEVAPQSCFEDAKIHTDRDHEINGIDARGLPAELLGADVILTPGDARPGIAKDTEGLQIEIETARPAQIYLVYMEGLTPPDWVLRDYVKTNMHVGLDFDASHQSPGAKVDVGPGQSIDRAQRVWRRKQPIEGRALVAEQMDARSAYTLLAVPVHETP